MKFINNYTANLFYYLHILLCLIVLSIPIWNKSYLKIAIFIPFFISLIWIFFDGCPVSKLHNMNDETFTKSIYMNIIPTISEKQNHYINTNILLGITILTCFRIIE